MRRSSAIHMFFAKFLKCDSRTIMKSLLTKIARKFSGNFVRLLCKFHVNSQTIFLRNDFIIVRLSHLRNPAKNLQIAELRLMRNPPQEVFMVFPVYLLWVLIILVDRSPLVATYCCANHQRHLVTGLWLPRK